VPRDPSDGPTPLIKVSTLAQRVHNRRVAHVLDAEIIKGANKPESASRTGPVHYRTAAVGGISVFYRGRAGQRARRAPAARLPLLLAHVPRPDPRLSGAYHVIAPDYPAFGHSAVPDRVAFGYTFDHLADVVDGLPGQLELWVRDSEHKSHVSGRVLEPCSGDVVIDVAVDDGQCLA
jgi:hypothetical protein